MRVAGQLMRKIRLSLGLGIVKLVDDARQIQSMQVTALKNEVRDKVNHYQPYGYTSNPKEGAEAVLAALGGNRSHLVAICIDDGRYRKKNLDPGEVSLYHWEGGYLHFKNGKEVHLSMAAGKVFVDAPEVTVTASTKVTLDTPTVECKHDLKVDGKLDVTGDATLGAKIDVTAAATFGSTVDAAGLVKGSDFQAGVIILTGHHHISATPGSPVGPPIP